MNKQAWSILNVNAIYISLYIMGYPLFAIVSEIVNIDFLTLIYRGIILFSGLCVFITSFLKKNACYTYTQIYTITICAVYGLFVIYYFSNGHTHEILNNEYYFNNLMLFTIIPLFLFSCDIDERIIALSVKYMYVMSVILLLLVAFSFYSSFSYDYRLSFEKINPISLSLFCAISVVVVVWHNKSVSIKSIFLIVSFIYYMVLTGSRGPLLALFAMLIVFSFRKINLKAISILLLSTSVLLYMFVGHYKLLMAYVPILNRFDFLSDEGSMSISIREYQYNSALDIFTAHPVLGGALVESYMNYYPHNLILEILMVGGGVFFLMYLAYAFIVVRDVFYKSANSHSVYLRSIILMLFFSYMTSSSLASIGLLFFFIVLASKNGKYIHSNN